MLVHYHGFGNFIMYGAALCLQVAHTHVTVVVLAIMIIIYYGDPLSVFSISL